MVRMRSHQYAARQRHTNINVNNVNQVREGMLPCPLSFICFLLLVYLTTHIDCKGTEKGTIFYVMHVTNIELSETMVPKQSL